MEQQEERKRDIFLREMTGEDTDRIIRWRNSEFVRRNFIYQEPFTREGHAAWTRDMIKTGRAVQFMICLGEQPIGSVYLRDIDPKLRKAEFGIFIGEKEALGKGYGTRAAREILKYAFEQMKLHKVMLRVLAENLPAQKSYEKAGFVREAYLRDEVLINGEYRDLILMAVLNENDKKEAAGL